MGEPDPDDEPEAELAKTPVVENQAGVHGEDTVINDAIHHDEPAPQDVNIGSPVVAPILKSPTHASSQEAETITPLDAPVDPPTAKGVSPLGPPVMLAQDVPKVSSHQRRRSDGADPPSDVERSGSPSRKRKLVTRSSTFANDSSTHHEEYSKRQRDEDGLPKAIPEASEETQPDETTKPAAAEKKSTPASPPPKAVSTVYLFPLATHT